MISLDQIQGHWRRDWIKAPGFEDHTTRVHWIQVGATYADIRVPADRPDLADKTCLADLSPADLALCAQAEGFAGHVTLKGETCTWQREINWHGRPQDSDIGTIRFDADGRMIEAGVQAAYTELWVPADPANSSATRLRGAGYEGWLLRWGTTCVLGLGKREKPAMGPVIAALQAGDMHPDTAALFDGLHALGRLVDNKVIAELASNPFSEAQPVLTLSDTGALWHRIDFTGRTTDVALQVI